MRRFFAKLFNHGILRVSYRQDAWVSQLWILLPAAGVALVMLPGINAAFSLSQYLTGLAFSSIVVTIASVLMYFSSLHFSAVEKLEDTNTYPGRRNTTFSFIKSSEEIGKLTKLSKHPLLASSSEVSDLIREVEGLFNSSVYRCYLLSRKAASAIKKFGPDASKAVQDAVLKEVEVIAEDASSTVSLAVEKVTTLLDAAKEAESKRLTLEDLESQLEVSNKVLDFEKVTSDVSKARIVESVGLLTERAVLLKNSSRELDLSIVQAEKALKNTRVQSSGVVS